MKFSILHPAGRMRPLAKPATDARPIGGQPDPVTRQQVGAAGRRPQAEVAQRHMAVAHQE